MDLSTVPGIVSALFALFIYVPDIEQFGVEDNWRSYAAEVRLGKKFRDDCDGFALTAVDLLLSIGIEAHPLIVRGPRIQNYQLHMIAVYVDPASRQTMTLDHLYPGPRELTLALSGSRYSPIAKAKFRHVAPSWR